MLIIVSLASLVLLLWMLWSEEKFVLEERRISLSEFHTADEVWTTGTMGEITPVVKIDGRQIGDGEVGSVTKRIQRVYKNLTHDFGVPIPTYERS
ncbi:unnamed protein product [Linum trigynum]|uniref:Uncharacterized protein n=1 Tax=Linum trigynum TaxID=586398 RepID=A0AAV2F9P3_9ROSI